MDSVEIHQEMWYPGTEERHVAKISKISEKTASDLEKTGKLNLDHTPISDVAAVNFFRLENFTKVPENLTFYFPNMSALKIYHCPIKKIARNDLKSLAMLKEIHVEYSDVEELPGEFFGVFVKKTLSKFTWFF
jgi:hypothetical protein